MELALQPSDWKVVCGRFPEDITVVPLPAISSYLIVRRGASVSAVSSWDQYPLEYQQSLLLLVVRLSYWFLWTSVFYLTGPRQLIFSYTCQVISKMEALATSAVVSSIVQLLSNGAKIYNLVDESLTKNATVEQITKDLLPLNDSLKRSLQYAGNPSWLIEDDAAL